MNTLTRRTWLQMATLASVGTALGQGPSPKPNFASDPRDRIAVATYPFRAMIVAPENSDRNSQKRGMTLAQFAKYVREEFNVFGIEPLHSHFASTEPGYIASLRTAFDDAGVRTMNIPVDARTELCNADAQVREQGYAIYRRWVDIAVALSSPSIRVGSVPTCGGAGDAKGRAAALKPVVEYGASRGIIVNLENDDPTLGNAQLITEILQAEPNPWFRALPDFANALLGGGGVQANSDSVRLMFQYAANIAHVKDGETVNGKDVSVSLKELFSIAKQAGYRGHFSMESETSRDPAENTHSLIEQSLKYM